MKKTVFDNKKYIQNVVLWEMIGVGYARPGSFLKGLIECCMRADKNNTERLRLGFPVVVGAVRA